ncbi:hypothetical protein [Chitinimonas naiadis]
MPTKPSLLVLALLLAAGTARAAETVNCHVSYGGEVRLLQAEPVDTPYPLPATAIGSYFLFRPVFERSPTAQAAIKLYTYADRDEGAVPIHQASFPYPLRQAPGRYGFTGLQTVYEPMRDGELQYWCELTGQPAKRSKKP